MKNEDLKIDLVPKAIGAKVVGLSRARITQLAKERKINTYKVHGRTWVKISEIRNRKKR